VGAMPSHTSLLPVSCSPGIKVGRTSRVKWGRMHVSTVIRTKKQNVRSSRAPTLRKEVEPSNPTGRPQSPTRRTHRSSPLDRYTAPNDNLGLVAWPLSSADRESRACPCRIASGPSRAKRSQRYWQPARGSAGISRGGAPWLVGWDARGTDAGTGSGAWSGIDEGGSLQSAIRSNIA
jgi:hypothetical protein